MLLPSIETPTDLRSPHRGPARRARRGDPGVHRRRGHEDRRAPRLEPRRGRAHDRAAPCLRLPSRRPALRHRPPGLRAQAAHRAPLRLQGPEAARAGSRGTRAARSPSTTGSRAPTPRPPSPTPTASRRRSSCAASSPATAGTGGSSPSSATARSPVAWPTRRSTTSGTPASACVIVLNDNGRSYAPTVSRLSESLTSLRLDPTYLQARDAAAPSAAGDPGRRRVRLRGRARRDLGAARDRHARTRSSRRSGVRYVGPIDGHDVAVMEQSFRYAAEWDGPIVVHVLTEKGRGYAPAEQDDVQRLHDFRVQAPVTDEDLEVRPQSYTDAFSRALVELAERDDRVVALTAAMPGPTGLLPFQERFPDALLRRGHRRAARDDRGRGHGHGRPAPGGRGLLDVLHAAPSTRPTSTWDCTACPSSRCSIERASPGTTARATTASSTSRCASPSRT